METAVKVRQWLINTAIGMVIACLFMLLLIICNNYNASHHKAQAARNDVKASEYRMHTEQLKMQTAKLKLEVEEAHLQAFIKIYSKEDTNEK